jgi:hypothetical protein
MYFATVSSYDKTALIRNFLYYIIIKVVSFIVELPMDGFEKICVGRGCPGWKAMVRSRG